MIDLLIQIKFSFQIYSSLVSIQLRMSIAESEKGIFCEMHKWIEHTKNFSLADTNQSWPKNSFVKFVANFANDNDRSRLLVGHFLLEKCLVKVWIELLIQRIDLHQSIALEHLIELCFRHSETLIESFQMCILIDFLFRNSFGRWRENIGHIEQVLAEWLNAENLCVFDLFGETFTHVFTVSQRSLVFIIQVLVLLRQVYNILRKLFDVFGQLLLILCQFTFCAAVLRLFCCIGSRSDCDRGTESASGKKITWTLSQFGYYIISIATITCTWMSLGEKTRVASAWVRHLCSRLPSSN